MTNEFKGDLKKEARDLIVEMACHSAEKEELERAIRYSMSICELNTYDEWYLSKKHFKIDNLIAKYGVKCPHTVDLYPFSLYSVNQDNLEVPND